MHAILYLSAFLLALIALSIRTFKNASSLTFVDYSRVTDRHALHRGAAARLFVVSVSHLLLGLGATLYPYNAERFVAIGFLVVLPAGTIWLVLAARKLHVPR